MLCLVLCVSCYTVCFLFSPLLRFLFSGPELPAEALPRTSEGGEFSHVRRGGAHIRQHPGNRPVPAPVSTQPYRGNWSGQSVSSRVRLQELSGERIIEILILFWFNLFILAPALTLWLCLYI